MITFQYKTTLLGLCFFIDTDKCLTTGHIFYMHKIVHHFPLIDTIQCCFYCFPKHGTLSHSKTTSVDTPSE
jgi:hypothetical protein